MPGCIRWIACDQLAQCAPKCPKSAPRTAQGAPRVPQKCPSRPKSSDPSVWQNRPKLDPESAQGRPGIGPRQDGALPDDVIFIPSEHRDTLLRVQKGRNDSFRIVISPTTPVLDSRKTSNPKNLGLFWMGGWGIINMSCLVRERLQTKKVS